MKIAWIIGTNISSADFDVVDAVNNSGGWNNTQLRALISSQEISELVIISIRPEKTKKALEENKKVKIYHLPYRPITRKVNIKLINDIDKILNKEKPDLVDIQGTENTYAAITFIKTLPCPVLITLHGVAYQCERFYTRGFPAKSLFFDRTIVDNLAFKGVLEKKHLMNSRAEVERRILQSVKYIRGRTAWDRACVLSINPDIQYFHEELILRDAFMKKKWNPVACQPHRIFAAQANSPLKSLYTLLEAVSILKKKYEDVELIVPGHPLRKGLVKGGHDKLIAKQIKKYGLESNVKFTGNLSANQMAEELIKARVFVLQSEIENSPNSLAEAQMIGTPSVSSFTGGTPEYIKHGETGFLYNSFDPVMAAMYIDKLFTDDALCMEMSEAERKVARCRHDGKIITEDLLKIYENIIAEENG